jgi:hypothetical protein
LKLYNLKAGNGWTDKSFTELLYVLKEILFWYFDIIGGDRVAFEDDPLLLLSRYAKTQLQENRVLTVDMAECIFNLAFTEALGRDQIMEALRHYEIGASIITTYIR